MSLSRRLDMLQDALYGCKFINDFLNYLPNVEKLSDWDFKFNYVQVDVYQSALQLSIFGNVFPWYFGIEWMYDLQLLIIPL